MYKKFSVTGAFSGALAVAFGAFGAHGLRDVLSEDALRIFHTGVEYQFYHSLALLTVGLLVSKKSSTHANAAGNLFMLGILLFSGSLYCLALMPSIPLIGIVTPIGGLCFVTGWLLLAYAAWKTD